MTASLNLRSLLMSTYYVIAKGGRYLRQGKGDELPGGYTKKLDHAAKYLSPETAQRKCVSGEAVKRIDLV